ncbi:ATP-grasp domain-containing protein [Aquimarina sp. ERC-38]|uniref:ATP-grasp domain-containing protein n=1 Tax=Aquimarina sp. ERC-38 TaxID=2949996 RepID=UPI00224815CE|nr:ATP-grasp domain-containing protein [Aquimarina sp. ERC-38]UZO82366.1 ATP-grasp domain-containing protein [Aquimarina sp. ERC-38]
MNNILITSAGRRVSLTRAFQKELKEVFPDSKVFVSDAAPELSSAAQIADRSFNLPLVKDPAYIDVLITLCKKEGIKLIVPTIDPELPVLAENYEKFVANGIYPIISSAQFISYCNDKRNTHHFFATKNIKYAKEYSRTNYTFPFFIKPIDGSGSSDLYIIKEESDLSNELIENEKLLFLEYYSKKEHDEYTCDLYYDRNHDLKCIVPRKRIEIRGGEVSKGLTRKNILMNYISQRLQHIEGARGCLTFQFFVHAQTEDVIGIEINARFGGGYPLSYLAGANYPKWVINEYLLDKPVEPFDQWKDNLLMLRYDSEVLVEDYHG